MATAKFIRAGKAHRISRPPRRQPAPPDASALRIVRSRLETIRAATVIASAALLRQGADIDPDVSLLLQRFVVAEIGHQIEALDAVLAGGAPRTPNLHDCAGGRP
jgi:hypothetical protein